MFFSPLQHNFTYTTVLINKIIFKVKCVCKVVFPHEMFSFLNKGAVIAIAAFFPFQHNALLLYVVTMYINW